MMRDLVRRIKSKLAISFPGTHIVPGSFYSHHLDDQHPHNVRQHNVNEIYSNFVNTFIGLADILGPSGTIKDQLSSNHSLQLNKNKSRLPNKMCDLTNSGSFSISSIMGFDGKRVEMKCNKEESTNTESNVYTTPKSAPLKTERVKKVKRLSDQSGDSKRYRATFDKAQIFHMERVFLINHYPDVASRSELSKATALSESQVQIWFQNRRAKWRKQQRKRRQDIPAIFGLGYPSHLARMYTGYDPYHMFPYEYYNTDFWSCAQQQIAAMHYSGLGSSPLGSCILTPPRSGADSQSPPIVSPVSSPSSPTNSNCSVGLETTPVTKSDKEALEIRNDASLSSLRIKAKEHVAALEASGSS